MAPLVAEYTSTRASVPGTIFLGNRVTASRSVPILVEQHFGNARLAANYAPGDEIRYKIGSPAEHGIADNSTATVLSVDARANTLTVVTRDANEVSFNPALQKLMTGESAIFREELRDLAVSERIRLTASDRPAHLRSGDFGTVERIGEDYALSVRLDNGKLVELDAHKARHIEYGYAVETAQRTAADRVLVSGDASQLAQQHESLARLSPHIRDLTLYTSDSRELAVEKPIPGPEIALSQDGLLRKIDSVSKPSVPQIELEGFGIGL
jgi:hypothetical protein